MSDDLSGQTIGDYRFLRQLGSGSLGTVYQALHIGDQQHRAIKVIHSNIAEGEAFQAAFAEMMPQLAALDHAHIVRVMDYLTEPHTMIIMEYISGESLKNHITNLEKNQQQWSFFDIARFGIQVADALKYAHSHNILHRALKPQNVLFRTASMQQAFQVAVGDFGSDQLLSTAPITPITTPTSLIYMAPEFADPDDIDELTDVYLMGLLLYETITGEPPFEPKTPDDALRIHRDTQPPSITRKRPDTPEMVAEIVNKCLAKKPEDRYQNATDLLGDLRNFLSVGFNPRISSVVAAAKVEPEPQDNEENLATDPEGAQIIEAAPPQLPEPAPTTSTGKMTVGSVIPVDLQEDIGTDPEVMIDTGSNQVVEVPVVPSDAPSIPPVEPSVSQPPRQVQRQPDIEKRLQTIEDASVSRPPRRVEPSITPQQPAESQPPLDDSLIYTLIVVDDKHDERRFKLERDSMVLGRSPYSDVQLDSHQVTGSHARLDRHRSGFTITDLGTTNGTWLDDVKLDPQTPTLWEPGQTVRIGTFWLMIDDEEAVLEPTAEMPSFMMDFGDWQPAEPMRPDVGVRSPVHPSPLLEAQLVPPAIDVAPGGVANLLLEIINYDSNAAHFVITPLDVAPSWVQIPEHSIVVQGNQSTTVSILIHPPRISSSTTGVHALTLQIKSLAREGIVTAVRGQLRVLPFHDYTADLTPSQIRDDTYTSITIKNLGNAPDTYTIGIDEYIEGLNLEIPEAVQQLMPAQSVTLPMRASVVSRPVLGGTRSLPFTLYVASDEMGVQQTLYGNLLIPSQFRTWVLACSMLIILLAACGTLSAVGFAGARYAAEQAREATATSVELTQDAAEAFATGTQIVIDATATFQASDPDADGLTNAEESLLETDPELADTDGDGILDGEDENPRVPDEEEMIALEDPVEFVRAYYEQVIERNYEDTWPYITESFRISTGTANFELYEQWWDQVRDVTVVEIRLVSNEGDTACVYADLRYEMFDGRSVNDYSPYTRLIRDPVTNEWRIDARLPYE